MDMKRDTSINHLHIYLMEKIIAFVPFIVHVYQAFDRLLFIQCLKCVTTNYGIHLL